MRCPYCGYMLAALEDDCPRCDRATAKTTTQTMAQNRVVPLQAQTYKTCLRCQTPAPLTAAACRKCGRPYIGH